MDPLSPEAMEATPRPSVTAMAPYGARHGHVERDTQTSAHLPLHVQRARKRKEEREEKGGVEQRGGHEPARLRVVGQVLDAPERPARQSARS